MQPKTLLAAFLTLYFVILLLNASSAPFEWDEGTTVLMPLFLSDFAKWWLANPTLSFSEIQSFALDFNLHYKGAYLFFYFPLLFRLVAFPFLFLFEPTLLVYRFIPILSSLACLVGMFFLSKKLGLSDENSVFTVSFLSLIPIFFNQSYHAYGHILAAAFVVWTAFFYISKDYSKFTIFSILTFHARYTTGLIWVAALLDTFLNDRSSLKQRLKQFAVYLLFTIPWLFIMQVQPFSPNVLTSRYLGEILFQSVHLSDYLGYITYLPIFAMPLLVLLALASTRRPNRGVSFLLLFAAATVIFYSTAASDYGTPNFVFQYLLPAIIFIPLFAEVVVSKTKNPRLANASLLALSLAFLVFSLNPTSQISPQSFDWGGPGKADLEQISWVSMNSVSSGMIISNQAETLIFRTLGVQPYLFQYPSNEKLDSFILGGWKAKYPTFEVPDIKFSFLLWDDYLSSWSKPPQKPLVFQSADRAVYLLGE